MTEVKTGKVIQKLERVVDFRIRRGASRTHRIKLQPNACPSTDGTYIHLPQTTNHFKNSRDNEVTIANSTAHESDHIREIYEYFGEELAQLQEAQEEVYKIYFERNYSELTENPALAAWIDNVVKDRRIDHQRRQLPGVKRYYREVFDPAASYFRPSIQGMSELDAFREQLLQKTLIGSTVEPVPANRAPLLEELVAIAVEPEKIQEDPEAVKKIYQKLKEQFDITQPVSKLPPLFGTGDHTKTKGSPQKGYSRQVQPREGRSDITKPEQVKDEEDKKTESIPRVVVPKQPEKEEGSIDEGPYREAAKAFKTSVYFVKPDPRKDSEIMRIRTQYAGEIARLKVVFRRIRQENAVDIHDFTGYSLEYDEYLQGSLEARATGIHTIGKYFSNEGIGKSRPAWALLADISPSTDPNQNNLIGIIKETLFVNAEALSETGYPLGLFAFSGGLYVVKDFQEPYTPTTTKKIVSISREREDRGGTALGENLQVIREIIIKRPEKPKGITIITDGKANNQEYAKEVIETAYRNKVFPFVLVIGEEFRGYAQELTQDLGPEHYIVIPRNKVNTLPEETFRIFRQFGVAR